MFYARKQTFGPVEAIAVGVAPGRKPVKPVVVYRMGSLLIDTGPHHLRKHILTWLDGAGISTILLTHHHEDHSGNSALLHERLHVPVYANQYGVDKLANGFNILPYQHILFGKARAFQASPMPQCIEDGPRTIIPYHTPGHSKDHTVFLVKDEGWLFSGDLWVGERIQYFRVDEDFEQQIASLRKIASLDFEVLFCAHRPSMKHGKTLIKRKLDHFLSFRQQVAELHGQGLVLKEIVRRLRKKSDLAVRLFTMGNASFTHMVRSAINSLDR